jgi:acetyl-CoA carboxylase biotin carboxyl carrier protein
LNQRFRLLLPEGASGRVGDGLPAHRVNAVEYGQTLFRLVPAARGGPEVGPDEQAVLGHPAGAGLEPGSYAVASPTDGVYYGRPDPGSPPFVQPGSRIRRGQTVGLVEVMKTFNQILYDGPALPEQAEVVEVRASDGEEVRAGQVLVVVR